MKYLEILFAIIILGISGSTFSKDKNLLKNGGGELGQAFWVGLNISDEDFYSGKYCFRVPFEKKSEKEITYWYIIKIDPYKLYDFSMKVKSIGKEPCTVLVKFIPHDKMMRGFNCTSIYARMGTESELVADANPGDNVLKISNGEKWFKHPRFAVAFYTRKAYKDIPNMNLSSLGIDSIVKKNRYWEVKLKHPLKKSYAAGTSVRMHRAGPDFKVIIPSQLVPNDWKELSCKLKGVRKLFDPSASGAVKKFWYGTAYVGIKIVAKGTIGKSELLIDDISLTER